MSDLQLAESNFKKADHRLKVAVSVLIIFSVTMIVFLVIQSYRLQNTIAENQKLNSTASIERFQNYINDNATQHEKTQSYVKCIASVLLQPINERTNAIFDTCKAPVDIESQ